MPEINVKKRFIKCPQCLSIHDSTIENKFPNPTHEEFVQIEASFAEVCVNVYNRLEHGAQVVNEENIGNLLTAIIHLCEREKISVREVFESATVNFFMDKLSKEDLARVI